MRHVTTVHGAAHGPVFRSAAFILPLAFLFLSGCATIQQALFPSQEGRQSTAAASQQKPAAQKPAAAQQKPSSPVSAEALGLYRTEEQMTAPPSVDELSLIASAKTLIGQPPNATVLVHGKQFTLDCIGTVSAIYYKLYMDITKDFNLYSGNGVNRLYQTLKAKGALHDDKYPRPGDIIFWDNTWDANGNGNRTDDPRTHAGIALAVDDDGTIHYIHENLYKGVMIEVMNLLRPNVARDENGKVINSGLAIATNAGGQLPVHWLSGDVFNKFGDALGLKSYFKVDHAERADDDDSLQLTMISLQQ
jgi:hypothetical protein